MIEIICTDCVKALSQMERGILDVVVTSPPYNLGINYDCAYDDAMPRQDYLHWMTDVGHAISGALSDQGSFFLNVGSKPTDPMIPFDVLQVMARTFTLQNTIHWVKSISIGTQSVGHYKPINSSRFINDCHEYIFHLTKTGKVPLDRLAVGVPYADESNVKRWAGKQNIRCRGNTWFIDSPKEDVDASWLALLVDTEGCIISAKNDRESQNRPSPAYHAQVQIANTHLGLLETALSKIGDGRIHSKGNRMNRPCYTLHISAQKAAKLLARIYPYLIVKKEQARCALYLENILAEHSTTRLSGEELALRDRLYQASKALNQGETVDLSWVPEPDIVNMHSSNALFIPYNTIQSREDDRPHPATFPVELPEMCFKLHGLDRITWACDPFVGIGNSAIAAKNLGIANFVGMDLSPTYCRRAIDMLKEEADA